MEDLKIDRYSYWQFSTPINLLRNVLFYLLSVILLVRSLNINTFILILFRAQRKMCSQGFRIFQWKNSAKNQEMMNQNFSSHPVCSIFLSCVNVRYSLYKVNHEYACKLKILKDANQGILKKKRVGKAQFTSSNFSSLKIKRKVGWKSWKQKKLKLPRIASSGVARKSERGGGVPVAVHLHYFVQVLDNILCLPSESKKR